MASNNIMLFSTNQDNIQRGWLWSEKYDGIRATWDGKYMKTRGGVILDCPFNLPTNIQLDGELFLSYYEPLKVYKCIRATKLNDIWNQITYKVFDIPSALPFTERYMLLRECEKEFKTKYPKIQIVHQTPLGSTSEISQILNRIHKNMGEGIVVRNPNHVHYTGRSKDGVKIKLYHIGNALIYGRRRDGYIRGIDTRTHKHITMRGRGPQPGQIVPFYYQSLTKNNFPKYPVLKPLHLFFIEKE